MACCWRNFCQNPWEIEIKLTRFDDQARLTIRDSGTRIPESEVPRIFERFHRVDGAQGRTYEGTGIGLALVQELVKLHGGSISVKSVFGQGTEFAVEIPFGKNHILYANQEQERIVFNSSFGTISGSFQEEALRWLPAQAAKENFLIKDLDQKNLNSLNKKINIPEKMEGRARVLLADDNLDMRNYLTEILQTLWDVEAVADGEAALASALLNPPDLILSDVMMPKMNGIALVEKLKQSPKTSGVPIILLSARAGEESRLEGLRLGADDYLVKPFSRKELLVRVKTHLQIGKLRTEAERQNTRLLSFFMGALGAICVLEGPEHIYTLSNPLYDQLVLREVIGKKIRNVFSESEVGPFFKILDQVYKTGESHFEEEKSVPFLDSNGQLRERFINFAYHSLRDSQDQITGVLAFHIDVTEQISARRLLERAAMDLNYAKLEADSANSAKSVFLANMSHEIRTPLGAIMGFVDLLKDPRLSKEDAAKYISIVDRNSHHLLRIIDDVLDLAKVEAGKIVIENIKFSLFEFLQDFSTLVELRARENGIEFFLKSEGVLLEYIISDPTRIRQILTNIVGNAIKFTEHGHVELTVEFNEHTLHLCVRDTGKGISKVEHAKLFQAFAQADPSTTRKFGGTGLGLVLTKRLSQTMGGDFDLVESEVGKESFFKASVTVEVPQNTKWDHFKILKSISKVFNFSQASDTDLRGVKILLVEDSPDNQVFIQRLLIKTGAEVMIASDGIEGIEKALSHNFDVILMDIQMPRMDGHEAARTLRSKDYSGPIIALTAHAMEEERQRAELSGFSDFLSKPIDSKSLLNTLSAFKTTN